MKKIRIPFLVVVLSFLLAGMAFAIDIPYISTWTQDMGVGGGGGTGLGDVLIGPLYDVRNLTDPNLPGAAGTTAHAQQTLIAIVNTDDLFGVVARLRFREWKRSRECLDIDIPLTTNDVWVAEISRLPAGGAVLKSPDRWISALPSPSLNTSAFPASIIGDTTGCTACTDFGLGVGNGIPFRTFAIEASEINPVARCEYGYYELIGEERVGPPITTAEPWLFPRIATSPLPGRDVQNVLMGNAYLIRPDIAISHQYNMVALSTFAVDPGGIWHDPGSQFPTLLNDVQGEVANPGVGGFNQLEAILSKRIVDFQYVNGVNGGTPMSTSVVITFPTKHFHYSKTSPFPIFTSVQYPGGAPFTGAFETNADPTPNSEIFNFRIFDRDENSFFAPPGQPISPPPVLTPSIPRLPFEVNVIGLDPHDPPQVVFRNNLAIGTANNTTGQTFTSGWGFIDLSPDLNFITPGDTRTAPQGKTVVPFFNFFGNHFNSYRGLPAIGIVMTEFFNGSVNGYFGNTVPWQFEVDWLRDLIP